MIRISFGGRPQARWIVLPRVPVSEPPPLGENSGDQRTQQNPWGGTWQECPDQGLAPEPGFQVDLYPLGSEGNGAGLLEHRTLFLPARRRPATGGTCTGPSCWPGSGAGGLSPRPSRFAGWSQEQWPYPFGTNSRPAESSEAARRAFEGPLGCAFSRRHRPGS